MRKNFCLVFLLTLPLWASTAVRPLDFYVIDVELGNAVLVVSPSGQTLLLDSGPPGDTYVNRVLEVMKLAGAKQIDYAVISHYHWDHYGALPALMDKVPVLHVIDHGADVEVGRNDEWRNRWNTKTDAMFEPYRKAREKTDHIVAQPGDQIPIDGLDVRVLTTAGHGITSPLPGAGAPNPACKNEALRTEDESEDAQSVGVVVAYGKFRFVDLGDLTWNKSLRLFCPNNLVGPIDAYLVDHHSMSMEKSVVGDVDWGRSCCSVAEVHGLHPRVSFMSAGEQYIYQFGTSEAFQVVRDSPGMEDIWETHYASQGGTENNPPEQFVANMGALNCPGHWIKMSAEPDGSFTVTNSRNGYTKRYPARAKGGKQQ